MFAVEARASVAFGLVLVSLYLCAAAAARGGLRRASLREAQFILPFTALVCTLIGYYLMQPLMAEARAGRGQWSFGLLHGISGALFAIKTLLVLALAWCLTARPTDPAHSA
jgi:predicted cobalt transporter CbtA